MDLAQLEYFLAVVEERSFTRAADRVCRTQPAVSQGVKKLEDELGTPLFDRDSRDIVLTNAGKALVEHARKMVCVRDHAVRDVAALRNLQTGTLTITAHESAAVYLLPTALHYYLQRYPEIKIGIHWSRLVDIPGRVLDREFNVGFVKDQPTNRELQWVEVHQDEMILIAPPTHPLARRRNVHISDLGKERLVVHHLCAQTEQMITQLFAQHSTRCRIAAELWSFENIKQFVQAEVGLAFVPRITVERELQERVLARVDLPEVQLPRRTLMIYRDQEHLSEPTAELIKIVRGFNWQSAARLRQAPARLRA